MDNTKAINLRIKDASEAKTLSQILTSQTINYSVTYAYEFIGDVPICSGAIFTIEEKNNE